MIIYILIQCCVIGSEPELCSGWTGVAGQWGCGLWEMGIERAKGIR